MTEYKILIVDDDPFNVDYLQQELADAGYQTLTAGNGEEALALMRNESPAPDLVLLDIMMPAMDGFEVLSRKKNDPAIHDIPVIVISAGNDLKSVAQGIRLGAEDFLPKPFEPVLLHARISSCLEKKHLLDMQQIYLKGLERELDIGREIQKDFLPAHLPVLEGWELAAYFKAAHEVAGDFYDAFRLPAGGLVCVLGDVCGKGVGAALYMTLFRSLIRAAAASPILETEENQDSFVSRRLNHITSFTNNYIVENHGDVNMFATVFVSILNPQTGLLTYSNCGNESPLLLHAGKVIEHLLPTGPVIGIIPNAVFNIREVSLHPGDELIIFTDGILDVVNPADEPFGPLRLNQILEQTNPSLAGLLSEIGSSLQSFISSASQFDDLTLLGLKRLS